MKIYESLIPQNNPTAVALGYFDGIHLGHTKVIQSTVLCKNEKLVPTVLTFSKSPSAVLFNKKEEELTEKKEKQYLIEKMGIEFLYTIDFCHIMNMSAEEFVKDVLHDVLKAKQVFCGFNYHFGKNGSANCHDLIELCKKNDINATVIEPVSFLGEVVSSTRIRNLLKNGDVKSANKLLAHRFGFSTKIVEGNHIGRTLNAPTINQKPEQSLILPRFGVYASLVTINGKKYCGVTNVGIKPTVGSNDPLYETWMPDFENDDLYGKIAEVRLLEFLRDEKKFDNLAELKSAIHYNAQQSKAIFAEITE